MNIRIGQGFDIHRFTAGRPLMLGGIEIPSNLGFQGHSDGDVLLHAIIDALLGAMALGDIGQWFPDTDPQYKGCDSKKLLKTVLDNERFQDWKLVNLDCTITTQLPKLAPHIAHIRQSLADLLHSDISQISVKAKTNEHLDSIGAGLGASANVVLLLSHV